LIFEHKKPWKGERPFLRLPSDVLCYSGHKIRVCLSLYFTTSYCFEWHMMGRLTHVWVKICIFFIISFLFMIWKIEENIRKNGGANTTRIFFFTFVPQKLCLMFIFNQLYKFVTMQENLR
jgi:hypothetical protein